jgi:hypothetical protein
MGVLVKAYRFYRVDRGTFVDVCERLHASDDEALAEVAGLPWRSDIEVWQQARFVARIEQRAAA